MREVRAGTQGMRKAKMRTKIRDEDLHIAVFVISSEKEFQYKMIRTVERERDELKRLIRQPNIQSSRKRSRYNLLPNQDKTKNKKKKANL